MPADETEIQWHERDSREWLLFVHTPDQLTARMTCTYLETGGVEARVGTQGGRFCVEVPAIQLERAFTVYQPADSSITPPMAEQSRKTGVHTGQRLRDAIANRSAVTGQTGKPWLKWVLRVAVITVLACLLLLIFEIS